MKKLLCLALCLILAIVPLGTLSAYASDLQETGVWKIGDVYYDTLKAAVATLTGEEDATVYLCQDLTETVIIDNTYTLADGSSTLADGMVLTVEGLADADGNKPSIKTTTGAALIVSYATIVVKNIDLEATGKLDKEEAGFGTAVLGEGAYVTFDGCEIVCGDGTYIAFRTRNNTGIYAKADDVSLTLKDTVIDVEVGNGITNEGFIAITVENGTTITSTLGNGIYSNSGSARITVNDGSITGGGVEGTWKYGVYGGDNTQIIFNGGYVQGTDCAVHGKEMNVTVNGGAFKATNASTYGCLNSNDADTVYTIVNGSFEGAKAACMVASVIKLAYPDGTTSLTVTASSCKHAQTTIATCTEKAACTTCGTEVGELDPENHTADPMWSATADKHTSVYPCCNTTAVAEADHTWNTEYTVDTAPTCTAVGSESIHCTECNVKKADSERAVAATGHTEGEWKTVKKATCQEEGLKHTVCTQCNAEVNTEVIPKQAHTTGDWVVDSEAQVGVAGHRHKVCTVCKQNVDEEDIPALEAEGGCKGSVSVQHALLLAVILTVAVVAPKKHTVKE